MQAVKSSGSRIERLLGSAVWALGLRYRKNNKLVFGRPDLTFKSLKIAVFVDSEFWHGKDWDRKKRQHKSNQEFWFNKIERNMERDRVVNTTLSEQGWTVIRFWGRDIESDPVRCASQIQEVVRRRRSSQRH